MGKEGFSEDLGDKMKFPFVHFCFDSITFQGKQRFFSRATSEEGKALEEGHVNKMQFPCVHFSICHLTEKIRLFFWARKLKRGRGLECIFPLYHFRLQHLARKIRFFFRSWELKAGKGNAGKRMEGDWSIPFMSFFKWFLKNPLSLVF